MASLGSWWRLCCTDMGHKAPERLKTVKGSAGPLYRGYFHPQKNKKERESRGILTQIALAECKAAVGGPTLAQVCGVCEDLQGER